MKVISIWQPFASLAVKGFKTFETRTWPAPASIIGQTIGIASTKGLKPAQRAYFEDERFAHYYATTGMPPLDTLPCGYLLGTVMIEECCLMTEEFMEEVSDEEKAYGHWERGNFAWRLANLMTLEHPIPIRGAQGIYDWNGVLPNGSETEVSTPAAAPVLEGEREMGREAQLPHYWSGLRVV
ncbi:ASCH domain-containing protein [Rhizobium sp. AN5]|uniref:ASCH domain-containing protein n=1 Tax=Rhizobium sp. AN5 TaxID=1855304 RepID=UPI000BDD2CDD|nr:ASCH domain-containing protein [Rhizobium sp. AN5]SOC90109.1 ASCH domain-containing protein [Rhizobium sp. AN5]